MTPTLNWKEAAALIDLLKPQIEGLFVDRIVVPERPRFPDGYVRSEWVIRLTGRRSESALFFSVRPRHPYLALCEGKGPKAATQATHSPFTLGLNKHLKGARVLSLEALPRERIVVLWLTAEGAHSAKERLGLVLCLIPAVPEALLVHTTQSDPGWRILSRSRTLPPAQAAAAALLFTPPSGSNAPENPPVREELFKDAGSFYRVIQKELDHEAFALRVHAAERELKDLLKQARERIRQSGTALKEAEREADWQKYGGLLKNALPGVPDITYSSRSGAKEPIAVRAVMDFETGETVEVPCDPKLDPRAQVEKFFSLGRRRNRRAEEARLRIEGFQEGARKWQTALDHPPAEGDWGSLEKFERLANIQPQDRGKAAGRAAGGSKGKASSWLGKSFVSKDGMTILVGRSKDENLELTFKHARGNDIWLHVRGRPGAHALVPLTTGKSAPLDTLLDAATLVIYYSGGEKWGKTEVDYTSKKYVKRIKDSTEASYTNNKTLLLEPDAARIKRLLGSDNP